MPTRRTHTLPQALLALAIEDRVDLCFRSDAEAATVHRNSPPINGRDYFAKVRALIEGLLRSLIASQDSTPAAFFDAIASTTVSVCGVVEANRTLLQLPLWHADMPKPRPGGGKPAPLFDFTTELANIAEKIVAGGWAPSAAARFARTVFVVNDVAACAAYEYAHHAERDADFVFVKCHAGINVGVVLPGVSGYVAVKTGHPEAGHGFPVPHPEDHAAGFLGTCAFHGWCYEGMLAVNGFVKRAHRDHPAFAAWRPSLNALEMQGWKGQELDSAFLRDLLKQPSAPRGLAVDLIAHYLGQVVLSVAIGPMTPGKIIIFGRMASPEVVAAMREKIIAWTNGYPWRKSLSAAGIADYILRRAPLEADDASGLVEAYGALAIAEGRWRATLATTGPDAMPLVNATSARAKRGKAPPAASPLPDRTTTNVVSLTKARELRHAPENRPTS